MASSHDASLQRVPILGFDSVQRLNAFLLRHTDGRARRNSCSSAHCVPSSGAYTPPQLIITERAANEQQDSLCSSASQPLVDRRDYSCDHFGPSSRSRVCRAGNSTTGGRRLRRRRQLAKSSAVSTSGVMLGRNGNVSSGFGLNVQTGTDPHPAQSGSLAVPSRSQKCSRGQPIIAICSASTHAWGVAPDRRTPEC